MVESISSNTAKLVETRWPQFVPDKTCTIEEPTLSNNCSSLENTALLLTNGTIVDDIEVASIDLLPSITFCNPMNNSYSCMYYTEIQMFS